MGAQISRRKSRGLRKKGLKSVDQQSISSSASLGHSVKGTTLFGRVYHDVESSVCKSKPMLDCPFRPKSFTASHQAITNPSFLTDFFPMDEIEQDRLHGVTTVSIFISFTVSAHGCLVLLCTRIFFFSLSPTQIFLKICQPQQHFGLKALFGGNLLAPIRDTIDLDNSCHVLDVGCGPGSWLLDLATSHPNSKFVGLDIVDMVQCHKERFHLNFLTFPFLIIRSFDFLVSTQFQFPSTIKPPNTEFLIGDILNGLPMFADNSFDLVQMRNFASVLKTDQWIQTLTELKRVCRPGGTIQLLEVDYKVCMISDAFAR